MNSLTDEAECPHDLEALYDSSVRALTLPQYIGSGIAYATAHIKLEMQFHATYTHMKRSNPRREMFEALRAIAQRHCKEA